MTLYTCMNIALKKKALLKVDPLKIVKNKIKLSYHEYISNLISVSSAKLNGVGLYRTICKPLKG